MTYTSFWTFAHVPTLRESDACGGASSSCAGAWTGLSQRMSPVRTPWPDSSWQPYGSETGPAQPYTGELPGVCQMLLIQDQPL
jgi:hypothetical protein